MKSKIHNIVASIKSVGKPGNRQIAPWLEDEDLAREYIVEVNPQTLICLAVIRGKIPAELDNHPGLAYLRSDEAAHQINCSLHEYGINSITLDLESQILRHYALGNSALSEGQYRKYPDEMMPQIKRGTVRKEQNM